MANTALRSVRIDDKTWADAGERADLEGRTVSEVVRIALRAYADGKYDAVPQPIRRPRK
jgi:antitoxin component of RelBE/YafQ-DinJ toxin-antitoxin module